MQEVKKYPLSMRLMHWGLGMIILVMLFVGLYMVSLPVDNPFKWKLYNLHKSFGVIVFVLAIIRLGIRAASQIPPLPKEVSTLESKLSVLFTVLLYLSMFIMPLSGYISSTAGGFGVKFFSLDMPNFFSEKNFDLSRIAITVHIYVAYFMIAVLCLHLSAPIKHLFIDKINVFKRMF
ncbi:cytochrome b [Holosporaceae bacterium 'Namur']|nr:cytochrome b [Holosporaceae bacterium 'Namur']